MTPCDKCPWLSEGGCTAARCVSEDRRVVPETLTLAQLHDACMSMRHDYGLMTVDQREEMRRGAADWWRCFSRALNDPARCVKEGRR